MGDLKEIDWPELRKYRTGSEFEPLEFYLSAFSRSTEADLLLGYFSFSAIRVIALGFAEFLANGGRLRIVANDILSQKDKDTLLRVNEPGEFDDLIDLDNLDGIKDRLDALSAHFFECIAWLIREDRLQIVLIRPKEKKGIAHFKSGIFRDGMNKVGFSGSCNFTAYGITQNLESLDILLPWDNNLSRKKVQDEERTFDSIISKTDDTVQYVPVEKAKTAIRKEFGEKGLDELLQKENDLRGSKRDLPKNERLQRLLSEMDPYHAETSGPKFPFPTGPRDYQQQAYHNWVENGYKGIFAMATGTGKTLTSLNCLLEFYKKKQFAQCIVIVPTKVLLSQWGHEAKGFKFSEVFNILEKQWKERLRNHLFLAANGGKQNFLFITTYASFNGSSIQAMIRGKKFCDLLLIADEVHNLGSNSSIKNLPLNIKMRIGLSATPNRKYDEKGSEVIEGYFSSKGPKYTYSLPMLSAIESGFLCKYVYRPYLTSLTDDETREYKELSKELLKHYDFNIGQYRKSAELLLIKRKRIVHQAVNKKMVFKKILRELLDANGGTIDHTLVYVPEGYVHDYSKEADYDIDDSDIRIINEYSQIIFEMGLSTHQVLGETKNRDEILKRFEKGDISVLTSMKTLDEGVDIPSTRNAIFCSSTGNPRQFIQRRGRVLRKHGDKERAYIYDLIVVPKDEMWIDESLEERRRLEKAERSVFRGELLRVANFLYACENRSDISLGRNRELKELVRLARKNEIDLDGLINDLIEQDN